MSAINNQMMSFIESTNNMQKGNELPKPYFELIERLLNGQVNPKLELKRDLFVNYKKLILKRDAAWRPSEDFRGKYAALVQEHVNSLAKEYLNDNCKNILELGSGVMVNVKYSHLVSKLPSQYQDNVTMSDVNMQAADHASLVNAKYIQLDSTEISKTIKPSSLDRVIASCFVDTLVEQDLKDTFSEISKVLKKDGLFIHISDFEPFFNTVLFSQREPNDIVFPLITEGQSLEGLQIISRENCLEFIKKNASSSTIQLKNESHYLSTYIHLSVDHRIGLILELCARNLGLPLSKWAKSISSEIKVINNESFFVENFEKAIAEAKFEKVKFGMFSTEKYLSVDPKNADEFNDVESLHGKIVQIRNYVFKPGVTRLTSTVHIAVLKKKSID